MKATIVLREADESLAEALTRFMDEVPKAPRWGLSVWGTLLRSRDDQRRFVRIAELDGAIAGAIVAQEIAGVIELEAIAVSPRNQRQGIGSTLVQELLDWALERDAVSVELEVRESNLEAQALYARCGGEVVGRRVAYYADPKEAALLLRLPVRAK